MSKGRTHIRITNEDKAKIDSISLELSAIENRRISVPELNRRVWNIPNLKDILRIDAERKRRMNKRGLFDQMEKIVLLLTILGVIILVFIIIALISPPLLDATSTIAGAILSTDDPIVNDSLAISVVPINTGIQNLRWIGYSLLIFPILGFLMLSYFVRFYPMMIIFWIFGIIILVICAIFFSSGYVNGIRGSYAT